MNKNKETTRLPRDKKYERSLDGIGNLRPQESQKPSKPAKPQEGLGGSGGSSQTDKNTGGKK